MKINRIAQYVVESADWPPKYQQLIKVKVWGHLSLIGAFEIFLQTKNINPDQKALDNIFLCI